MLVFELRGADGSRLSRRQRGDIFDKTKGRKNNRSFKTLEYKNSTSPKARRHTPAHILVVASVDDKNEDKECNKQDGCVSVRRQEGSFEAAVHGIGDDTPRDEEGGQVKVEAGESVHGGGPSE